MPVVRHAEVVAEEGAGAGDHQAAASADDDPPFAESDDSTAQASRSSGPGAAENGAGDGGRGDAPARDEAFFARETYLIPVTVKKGAEQWEQWIGWMTSAARDCRTREEYGKLRENNGRTLHSLQIKRPDLYRPFNADMNKASEEL